MSNSIATRLKITCPKCGKENAITATDLPDDLQIDCSRCHVQLGSWGDIRSNLQYAESFSVPGL